MNNRRVLGSPLTALLILTVLSAACSSRQTGPPADAGQPDRFLFERGSEALQMEDWVDARTYFQQLVDGYPQSPFRPDAKLGVGDAYLSQGTSESVRPGRERVSGVPDLLPHQSEGRLRAIQARHEPLQADAGT